MTRTDSFTTLLEPLRADLDVVQDTLRRITSDVAKVSRATQEQLRAGLQQLRVDVRLAEAELDTALAEDGDSYLTGARRVVDEWRARLDGLRVQANLVAMDVRDDVQGALSTAEQALSAAERQLSTAAAEAKGTLETLRSGAEQSLSSVVEAGRAAVAVVDRRVRSSSTD